MRVFITGAAGFIGSATVKELIEAGHQVIGLARSEANAEKIVALGGVPHTGNLDDLESLKSGVKAADGVIHLAFVHDFQNMGQSIATDKAAIEAMAEVAEGKPLVIASGTLLCPKGKVGYEDSKPEMNNPPFSERALSAEAIYSLSKEGKIRGSVIRLPPIVHGVGGAGLIPVIVGAYKPAGAVIYVDDGSARWPSVHQIDAARLFRLALEKAPAGSTYHGVAEGGIPMKDILAIVGKHLQLPVKSLSIEEAAGAMGPLAHIVNSDNPISSEKTQRELAWQPTGPGLLEDLDANYSYF